MIKEYIRAVKTIFKTEEKIRKLKSQEINIEYIDQEISENWTNYKKVAREELLKQMPIEKLDDIQSGIPIKTLKNNEINFIVDCLYKPPSYFKQFQGIGEFTSQKIVDTVIILTDAIYNKTHFEIKKNYQGENVLRSIKKKMEFLKKGSEIEKFNEDRENFIKRLKKEKNLANKKKFILPWIFDSNKELIDSAIEYLSESEISSFNEEYYRLTKFNNKISYFADFTENAGTYYAVLENTLDLKLDFKDTYLPDDLVNKIESLKLNTKNLKVTPRKYQYFGAQYMIIQEKTLLGDEMGLGKTIQALVAINHLYQENDGHHFVVIGPLSILTNWKREVKKWTSLKTYIFHGKDRDENFYLWSKHGGVLITNYGHANHLNAKRDYSIDMLVVDEAHYVKNPKARRSKTVYNLGKKSKYVTYMSGTPLENNLEEMLQLISVLQKPISDEINNNITEYKIWADRFKEEIAPVYLRRNRKDVLVELPDLEEIEHWVSFGKRELDYYIEGIKEANLMKMRRAAWTGGSQSESPKLNVLADICKQARDQGDRVLIFSFFRDVISTIYKELYDYSYGPITGDVSNEKRQDIIDDFSKSKPGSVLISQITAGGVGVNIQSANIIIICEPQYKPSTEEQAISRAYRMGQTKKVLVYRLLTEESVDERILTIIHNKKRIFNDFAKDSELANLSESAIDKNIVNQIVELESKRYGL